MSIVNRMISRRTQLSANELKIADWILAHPQQAALMTSLQLAEQVSASQSSIIKFAQKMGFKGYSAFKLLLVEELSRKQALESTPVQHNIFINDPLAVIAQKLVQAKTDAMFHTTNALCFEQFHHAVNWINQAHRVQIVGIGGSALTGKDLAFKLLKLGITALAEQDSHVQIATARTLRPQDVQIAISFSGDRKEVFIAAEAAKQQGAKVIALTAPKKSKLRQLADIALDTIADETQHRSSSIASRTAQNVLTDLLFISLVQQREDSARQLIETISSDIQQIL
ncbi:MULTISPECIES: MurR/RpiR family transcriptional regulator [Vibrio]|uniref:MurR/RpiR family transcriptional regulator n=1 Tax=Vibrio TaxID=662 RepID=UPI0001B93AF6|nr:MULTISPECIES: SIS domain-containing protein [Vibrio]EEX35819.1 transcriptional regulator RpiR family [Vibrio metschnikovii CIP 69.14]EKO3566607.1 SIS domain-containing protein [Vibrio metschnikovii]EKO3770893.1 SIS domain-containing protein [Vibrio metschnikovii]MBC3617952.1 SIS domain-containing protein [Vibrio metschnikovii]MBC3621839.1 SIS domain-containing protein [Vibrio metschnikovii]